MDDKTKVLDEKVKSAVAVFDVQHKNFKETIGSMPNQITGNIKIELGAMEKTLKADVGAVEKTLKADVSAVEKTLKTEVTERTKALSEKMDLVEKNIKDKFDFVEKMLIRVGFGIVATAMGILLVGIGRPLLDALVQQGVDRVNRDASAAGTVPGLPLQGGTGKH